MSNKMPRSQTYPKNNSIVSRLAITKPSSNNPFRKAVKSNSDNKVILNGKVWFYRLKASADKPGSSLSENIPITSSGREPMIVCRNIPSKSDKEIRLYSAFIDYIELYKYVSVIPPEESHFYEVIRGEWNQKPHFDIDISITKAKEKYSDVRKMADELIENLLGCIMDCIVHQGHIFSFSKHCRLYTSHGADKLSYHIVVNGFYHVGNNNSKAFYNEVIEKLKLTSSASAIQYIDNSVYSTIKRFRLLWSCKVNTNRTKSLSLITYRSTTLQYEYDKNLDGASECELLLLQFSDSLISSCNESRMLNSTITATKKTEDTISHEKTRMYLEFLDEKFPDLNFEYRETNGNIVSLKSLESLCPIHDKIHKSRSSYIYEYDGKVYWQCRTNGDRVLIGDVFESNNLSEISTKKSSPPEQTETKFADQCYDFEESMCEVKPAPASEIDIFSGPITKSNTDFLPEIEREATINTQNIINSGMKTQDLLNLAILYSSAVIKELSCDNDDFFRFKIENGGEEQFIRDNLIIGSELENATETQKQSFLNLCSKKLKDYIRFRMDNIISVDVLNYTADRSQNVPNTVVSDIVDPEPDNKSSVLTIKGIKSVVHTEPHIHVDSVKPIDTGGDRYTFFRKQSPTAFELFACGRTYPRFGIDCKYLEQHFNPTEYHTMCSYLVLNVMHLQKEHYDIAEAIIGVVFRPLVNFCRAFTRFDVSQVYWLNYESSEWIPVCDNTIKMYTFKEYINYLKDVRQDFQNRIFSSYSDKDKAVLHEKIKTLNRHIGNMNNCTTRKNIWTAVKDTLRKKHSRTPKLIRTNDFQDIQQYNIFPKALVSPDPRYKDPVTGILHQKVQLFKDHIRHVLCSGDELAYRSTISVYRKCIVEMSRIGKIPIHLGPQRSGKSSVLLFIYNCILGPKLMWRCDHYSQLVTKNNVDIEDKLILWVDDADNPDSLKSLDTTDWCKIISIVSDDNIEIKKLYVDKYSSTNHSTIMCLANNYNPIPSYLDENLTRGLCTQVSTSRLNDVAYWDFWHNKKDGMMNLETGALVLGWLASDECLSECINICATLNVNPKNEFSSETKPSIKLFYCAIFVEKEIPLPRDILCITNGNVYLCKVGLLKLYLEWRTDTNDSRKMSTRDGTFGRVLSNADKHHGDYLGKYPAKKKFDSSKYPLNCYKLQNDFHDIKVCWYLNGDYQESYIIELL